MIHKIAVIPGDGVGPEVINETLKVADVLIRKFRLPIAFDRFPYGADYYLKEGIAIPESLFSRWPREYSAVLLGALGDPRVEDNAHARDILMGLRLKLDLFVNFRPVKLLHLKHCPLKRVRQVGEVDFVIFRENTEDIYAGVGGVLKRGTPGETALENALHTYRGVERIIRAAFDYARQYRRTSVVMADKANAMQYAGDLWRRVYEQVGEGYPGILKGHMYIDALCMDIVRNPAKYSVIVTANMFGDILSDVAAEVQGGIGLAASANYRDHDRQFFGLYEPVHGSAPDIAGKNIANPVASILSFHLLLLRLGYHEAAEALYRSVADTVAGGRVTPDLGGSATTTEVGDLICRALAAGNEKPQEQPGG
jgi:3-isopropylmalate dehydrogenase